MAGYKQSEAEQKAKIDKRVKDDMHRRLLELIYYLPFGYKAEYFYCMMSYLLQEDCFYLMPNRITKPMLEIRAERENRKVKEAEPEPEQTAEEKQAGEYRCNIAKMVYNIESLDTIESIYSFIMGLLSVKKGGVCICIFSSDSSPTDIRILPAISLSVGTLPNPCSLCGVFL